MSSLTFAALLALAQPGAGAASPAIDSMDEIHFRSPAAKGKAELVPGKVGKAIRFSFDKDSRNAFFTRAIRGRPEWDRAAGISFWVKGGSGHFGGLQLIYDDDYALRYDYCFSLKNKEWTRITVAWRDFVPVLPGPKAKPLGLPGGNPPSKVSALWFGKWWYWGDYPAHAFAIDEIRLEEKIASDTRDYRPAGAPLERVRAKWKAGRPITVVTMGDSLTDFHHWANRETSWPRLLKKQLEAKVRAEVTLVNPAIGGTQLRQNLVLIPRWRAEVPTPDLVLFCFGANDWEAGMRGGQFRDSCADAVDRIRRATAGKSDVLILTTVPGTRHPMALAELAEACRAAARARNAGLADTEKAFLAAGKDNRARLYVRDGAHLSPAGHELMARTVLEAMEGAGK